MPRVAVEITHPDRVLFPADRITKADLVDYYAAVAETMLPHLKDRPLTLQRFPRGIDQQGFIQQDFADTMPDWMSSAEVAKEGGTVVHPLAQRPEALVWLANQNSITVHAWLSRLGRLDTPDRLVFDLDPSGDDFPVVRETARPSPACWTTSGWQATCRRPDRAACTWWCRCAVTPTSTRSADSPATSPTSWWPTIPRTARWKPARTSAAAGCTST
ncbi:putative aTP-dependent DNA ligase [Mycobacterium xenopi 4042]|uniref:Putative aTP-dependent DNA ligase n=1 Tax=Mycobacterium xenopi 4042 TaxID=1299334 RepID=X7YN77_MYCXE|nr:putative aTP-dependent DNA ligase [Mycobacterium xenopi 4042]